MSGSWRVERLPDIISTLAGRPRHEALGVLIVELLRSAFAVPYDFGMRYVTRLDGLPP